MSGKKYLTTVLLGLLVLGGCVSQQAVDGLTAHWNAENKKLIKVLGTKYYQIEPLKAHRAMIIALSTLDLIVENQDVNSGFILAKGTAPSPLTAREWKLVQTQEEPEMHRRLGPFVTLTSKQYEVIVNAFIIRRSKDVQVNLRFRTKYIGNSAGLIISDAVPPLAVKIGAQKIWEEFERVAFVQRQIIDK